MNLRTLFCFGVALSILVVTGCVTTRGVAVDEYDSGVSAQKQGQYDRASLYFRSYIRNNPMGENTEEARFRLGESYYLAGETTLALRELNKYTRLYPEGVFADLAKAYVSEIEKEIENLPERSEMQPYSKRVEIIEQLEQEVQQKPKDVSLQVKLANAYLDIGEMALAEKALSKAQSMASTLDETKKVREGLSRLRDMRKQGPVYATDLYGNPGPLRIQDAQGELRQAPGTYAFTSRKSVYVVTGQVVNESEKTFNRVRVHVNLYDFYENLLASRTVMVGNVPAWGRRAFAAEQYVGPPADSRISRFECRLDY
jgi:tetratricopeptide (TPR) repeat protein